MLATHDTRGVRAALVTVQLLFGINYLVSKHIVTVLDPGAWATLRATSALVILAALAVAGGRRLPPGRDIAALAVCALFGVTLNQIFFLEGLSRTTPAHASLICSQIPLFTLAAAILMRQEPLTVWRLVALLAGMSGVLILLEIDRFRLDAATTAGDLLVLTNAASYGLYIALSRRVMARNDPLAATAVVFFFGALGIALYGGGTLLRTDLGSLSTGMWAAMTFVVIGATVATYFLNLWSLKRTHASRVALYIFLQPVVATVLSAALLGEPVTWRLVAAAVLVFTSLALRERR
jgi:drug/metabolite transporter (DMT)-like permease